MRKAISSDAIRASSASSWPRARRGARWFSAWSRSSCSRWAGRERWRLLMSRMIRSGSIVVVVDMRPLVDPGQEAVAPQLRTDDRLAGTEHDEARAGSGSPCPGRRSATSPGSGRIGCMLPEFIIKSDGSWLGLSVYIERITQRSSMQPATCGKSSVTSMPLWPCGRAENGEGMSLPLLRSPGHDRRPGAAGRRIAPGPAWGRRCRRATARRS